MKRTLSLAIAAALATPIAGLAQQQPEILQSAERAALGMELPPSDASDNRRSMRRTWAGIKMIAAGALLASVSANETRRSCSGGSCTSETKSYKPLAYPGVALAVTGGLLATVWSDVPANRHIDFMVTADRIQVGKTFGF